MILVLLNRFVLVFEVKAFLGPDREPKWRRIASFMRVTHKKSATQNPPKFFSLQTRRHAKSFEGLNSSLALSAPEIFPHKDTSKLLVLGRKP